MTSPSRKRQPRTDLTVSMISGLLAVFVITALAAPTATSHTITTAFGVAAGWFGPLWQVLLLSAFVVAIVLACSRCGKVRLGDRYRPEHGRFNWVAMIMTNLARRGRRLLCRQRTTATFLLRTTDLR